MIDLHFTPTANGQKISIALEEVEIPYRLINYDIFEGDHHTPEFRKINPNQKVPAIVDHHPQVAAGQGDADAAGARHHVFVAVRYRERGSFRGPVAL